MGGCGTLPPGVGTGPSVFPTKKIYDTYTVTYDDVNCVTKPISVTYYDTLGNVVTTVTITYDDNGDPVWNGDTLKDHYFNVFSGSFEVKNVDQEQSERVNNSVVESLLQELIDEAKKINTYFAVITNHRL
jgi:hypothetical protein